MSDGAVHATGLNIDLDFELGNAPVAKALSKDGLGLLANSKRTYR